MNGEKKEKRREYSRKYSKKKTQTHYVVKCWIPIEKFAEIFDRKIQNREETFLLINLTKLDFSLEKKFPGLNFKGRFFNFVEQTNLEIGVRDLFLKGLSESNDKLLREKLALSYEVLALRNENSALRNENSALRNENSALRGYMPATDSSWQEITAREESSSYEQEASEQEEFESLEQEEFEFESFRQSPEYFKEMYDDFGQMVSDDR